MKQPIGILGFGVEGKSTLRFLQEKGFQNIKVFDKNPAAIDSIDSRFRGNDDELQNCKTIIRSSGVYPLKKEILEAQSKGAELTSQVELFFEEIAEQARSGGITATPSIIGVTGTLGKGSCVSMISHCLNELGVPNAIGGNFGVPALDLLKQNGNKVFILELSSFQLMTLSVSPHIAVVLQVTSEHLDWHSSIEQYRDAKANLVRWQKASDYCIYNADSEGAQFIASQSGGIKKPFSANGDSITISGHELNIKDCKITGAHQLQNAAAALLALQSLFTPPNPQIFNKFADCPPISIACGANGGDALDCGILNCIEALKTYEGLPYRLQKIGAYSAPNASGANKTITFYNDSYSTRPEATIAAVHAMDKPFTLILGGSEKNSDFTELSLVLAENKLLRGVALIGFTAQRILRSLNACGCDAICKIFDSHNIAAHAATADPFGAAFEWCCEKTENNGAVLLSPACASFGLFANYKERGEKFNELVKRLPLRA